MTAPGPERVAVACRVWAPALSIWRLVKLATPAIAAFVVVPWSVPPPVWIVRVTLMVESGPLVTVLPNGSSTLTTGWVANAEPAVAAAGWVL